MTLSLKICMIGNKSYQNPYPVTLGTILHLREIVNVDEDRNSISVQLIMHNFWKDLRITFSNTTIV